MYVCVCKAVTDKAIRQQVQQGACTMRDIRQSTCAGTQCGKCVPTVQAVLSQALSEQAAHLQIPCHTIYARPAA